MVEALRNYQYLCDAKVEPVKPDFVLSGAYRRVSRVYHDSSGEPVQTVLERTSTVGDQFRINQFALDRLARFYYFLISPQSLDSYDFNYIGREKVDALNTYVFDIRPRMRKLNSKSQIRYLKGRIWIDEHDLQVVKVAGEADPPPGPHRTPRFETYFQNYGNYWFPAYSWADDDLPDGDAAFRAIIVIRYSAYKKEG